MGERCGAMQVQHHMAGETSDGAKRMRGGGEVSGGLYENRGFCAVDLGLSRGIAMHGRLGFAAWGVYLFVLHATGGDIYNIQT